MRSELLENKQIISKLKSGIEYYSGKRATKMSVVEDPQVVDTYAIRCHIDKIKADFLIIGFKSNMTNEEISDNLEECEFDSFPPESNGLNFFL
jgi:hypothetical protein